KVWHGFWAGNYRGFPESELEKLLNGRLNHSPIDTLISIKVRHRLCRQTPIRRIYPAHSGHSSAKTTRRGAGARR
ncbi:MAG: hypothetical protein KAX88_01055, partial [Rhodoferax sp.]|nr:hypothetical protein [Rhodoferax sp.]